MTSPHEPIAREAGQLLLHAGHAYDFIVQQPDQLTPVTLLIFQSKDRYPSECVWAPSASSGHAATHCRCHAWTWGDAFQHTLSDDATAEQLAEAIAATILAAKS